MKPLSKKLNPIWWLGNDDDGICGTDTFIKEVCKGKCSILCKVKWGWRNLFHNFAFYVIGVADREFTYRSIANPNTLWADKGFRWNYGITKTNNFEFPLVSYRGNYVEWYIGWRGNGAFGLVLRRAKSKSM